jgi:hypothetical protein
LLVSSAASSARPILSSVASAAAVKADSSIVAC